jgi:hypothetical protein
MANNAPTPYAAPYLDMEKPPQTQTQPTEREYTYVMGDVVYRGERAREMEAAKSLYDSGDYDWAESQAIARQQIGIQKEERKLRAQETLLALGDYKAKLQQKEIGNNKIANIQKVGSEINQLNTFNLASFPEQTQKLREKYSREFTENPELQTLLADKIKEQQSYARTAQDIVVAAGGRNVTTSMLNKDGSLNAEAVSVAGSMQRKEDLRMSEEIKSSFNQLEANRKMAWEEIKRRKESGGRGLGERAQAEVARTGGKASYVIDGVKTEIDATSAIMANAERQRKEKENKDAMKAGKVPPNQIQETPAFNPSDKEAAKRFAIEQKKLFNLGKSPEDKQILIELVRAEGYNF